MGELEDKISGILNNPDQMGKLMNLARSLTGGGEEAPPEEGRPAARIEAPAEAYGDSDRDSGLKIDPDMVKSVLSGFSGKGKGKGGGSLDILDAVIPYLREERRGQLKRAMSLAKMAKFALSEFGGGDR